MINDLINIIKDVALRHKGVRTFRYQGDDYNNAQHNYEAFQVYVDTISYHRLNITTNIFTSELNIYILAKPENNLNEEVLKIQDEAFTIAVDIIGYIDYKEPYRGVLRVHDYDIMTIADYTAQRSAGAKLSLVLETPSPLNLCDIDSNFNDEPYEEEQEPELDIKTITLPIKKKC